MAINKGIGESANALSLYFILTINFRAHFPLLQFHFLGFLQRVLADGGRFEGQDGDSEKGRITGNKWIKESRNYSSYELALFYEFSKVYSMAHCVCLCYLYYFILLYCQFH